MPLGTQNRALTKKKKNECIFIFTPINIFFEYVYLVAWCQFDLQLLCFCSLCGSIWPFNPCSRPALLTLPPSDTAVPTVLLRHIWVPCWIAPLLQCRGPVTLSDKRPGALFAPACLPRCQISWAKPIEITITDLNGLYSLTVCWYALTQTSFTSIHKYVRENNCRPSLLVMFTLPDDWQDKLWQQRGEE